MFEHLKKYDITNRTVRFVIPWIEGDPVLIVRPATEANRDFQSAQLRIGRAQIKALSDRPSVKLLDEIRDRLRELYPQYVIVGWENVVDDNGEEVEFSLEKAKELVQALPSWIFDRLAIFCADPSNFALGDDEVVLGN